MTGGQCFVVAPVLRVVMPRLLSTFQSLATKRIVSIWCTKFNVMECSGEAIMLSREHLKFKKSELGRREGITSENLLSKDF